MAFRNIPPNGFPAIPDIEDLEGVEKDVSTLKTTTAGLAEDVGDLEEQKVNQITIALPFNPETIYEVGDLVYYNGLSYRCTNEHTGEWDADDFAGTTIANELASLKSGLTNETVLLNQLLTTTPTKYDLNGSVNDYVFIAFILGWYDLDSNDNMIVMPSSAFYSSDYLLIPRKNDLSTQAYAKINARGYADGVYSINAEGTEGVAIKVVGIIHK